MSDRANQQKAGGGLPPKASRARKSDARTSHADGSRRQRSHKPLLSERVRSSDRGLTHARVADLYEISKLFVGFESLESTVFASFQIVSRSMPLRSVILILEGDPCARTFIWRADNSNAQPRRRAEKYAWGNYAYLVDSPRRRRTLRVARVRRSKTTRAGDSQQPLAEGADTQQILLPLVVGRRGIFGAVQFESAARLDETDLIFANAMVNQLAVALEHQAAAENARAVSEQARRAAEQRREEAETLRRRYEALADNLDCAFVWEANVDTFDVSYVSARAEPLLGYSPRTWPLQANFLATCVHPRDRARVARTFRQALDDKQSQRCDHRSLTRDGRVLWLHTRVTATDVAGEARLQGLSLDVSAAKEVEAYSKDVEIEQRFLAEASNSVGELNEAFVLEALARHVVPVFADFCFFDLVTSSGSLQRVAWRHRDREKQALFDEIRPKGSLAASQEAEDDVPVSWAPELMTRVDEPTLARLATSDEQLELLRACEVRSAIRVPLVHGGRRLGVLTFCNFDRARYYAPRDLVMAEELARRAATAVDNARLYARAQRAIAARDQILATVSHDMKSPLSSILMCVDALLSPAGPIELHRSKLLHIIKRSAEGMFGLVRDLLDTASIDAGCVSVRLLPLDITSVLEEVFQRVQPLAAKRALRLERRLCADLPRVHADSRRMQQVFENLLSNAIKFTPEGGTVSVSAELRAEQVQFAVRDTGVGIPEQDVPHLFERFWQAPRTAALGNGLGLFIACGIIQAHGGKMWVESRLGAGTTVYLTLPTAGRCDA
jgi:PAS domain S-box-containing protein